MSSTKILVTGATGFLGANVIRALVDDGGYEITASGMHGSDATYVEDLAKVEFADITDRREVDQLVAGHDVVINLAGDTAFWRKLRKRQRNINVDGALNVGRACLANDARLVHTSTIDVLGHDPSRRPISEQTGHYNFDHMGYTYGDTKFEGERELRRLHHDDGLDLVVVYPGFMCGPFDFTLQLGQVFFDLRDKKFPGSPPGGSSYSHVADVARGHVRAARHGRSGEGYICAGHNMDSHDWFSAMADTIGADPPARVLPPWATVGYGYAAEAASLVTRKPPALNPGMARYLNRFAFCDSSKAINELGYEISPLQSCLADAVDWYRDNGYDL